MAAFAIFPDRSSLTQISKYYSNPESVLHFSWFDKRVERFPFFVPDPLVRLRPECGSCQQSVKVLV